MNSTVVHLARWNGTNLNQAHTLLPCKVITSHDKSKNQLACFQHLVGKKRLGIFMYFGCTLVGLRAKSHNIITLDLCSQMYQVIPPLGKWEGWLPQMRKRKAVNRITNKSGNVIASSAQHFHNSSLSPFC